MLKKMIMLLLMFLAIFGGNPLAKDLDPKVALANDEVTSSVIVASEESNGIECETLEGYSSVVDDLIRLGIYNDTLGHSMTLVEFITMDQIYNLDGDIETFFYLAVRNDVRLPNSNLTGFNDYDIKLAFLNLSISFNTDSSLIDDSKLLTIYLEEVSSDNNSYLKKYKVSPGIYVDGVGTMFELSNLNDSIRRYYLKTLYYYLNNKSNSNDSDVGYIEINKTYIFDNNLYQQVENDDNTSNEDIIVPDTNPDDNPMDDFENDDSFNDNEFSYDSNNKTLDIIQIAESDLKQLYIYIYNPTKELTATSINMSIDEGKTYDIYYLKKISSNECIDKYLVNGFSLLEDNYRYYNISTLYRYFNSKIDDDNNSDYTNTTRIGISIGKNWCCYYNSNKELVYEMENVNVVEIDPIITSYIHYEHGFTWIKAISMTAYKNTECAAHYIGFDVVNYDIEKIYDADIHFKKVPVTYKSILWSDEVEFGEVDEKTLTLKETDEVSFRSNGLLQKKYSWDRISTSKKFIENFKSEGGKLKDTAESDLNNCDYVFSFYESIIQHSKISMVNYLTFDIVTDVVVLRLHFLSEGKTYNLGVVSDVTESNGNSSGNAEQDINGLIDSINTMLEGLGEAMQAVLLILGIVIVASLVVFGISLIGPVIKLITYPFRLIKKLFKRKKRY